MTCPIFARALKDRGVPVPEIAKKLTVRTGKNAGQHPSVASVHPRRPTRVDLTGPGSRAGLELVERLTRQVLDGTSDEVTDALAEQTGDGTKDVVAQLLAQARNGGEERASDPGRSALVRPTARAVPGSLCGCGR
jgi:hypothetical protein